MLTLYAKCPTTGSMIDLGIQSDDDSLVIMAHSKVTIWCEKCRQHHVMRVRELHCCADEPVAA